MLKFKIYARISNKTKEGFIIKIKAFNLKETIELDGKIGIIEEIINSENSKKLIVKYLENQSLRTKTLTYNPKIEVPLTISNAILWNSNNTYILFAGLLIPIRASKKQCYKIGQSSQKEILEKQRKILETIRLEQEKTPLRR